MENETGAAFGLKRNDFGLNGIVRCECLQKPIPVL